MTKDYRWLLIGAERPHRPELSSKTSLLPRDADEIHLFARGQESIRITIHLAMKTLHVFGPGRVQKVHEFSSDAELQEFLQAYERSAVANGWTQLDTNDRRVASRSEP